jgi:RNA polymerase sigma-70 factor, ECF subfamily
MKAPDSNVGNDDFRELFDSVLPDLHNYIARQCSASEVDDLCAEIMAEVYFHWPWAPTGLTNRRMWVFGFARNKLLEYQRRKRHSSSLIQKVSNHSPTSAPDSQNLVAANDRVRRLLAQLPEKERETVYLTVFAGFSSAETAQILGISISAVTTRASRARQHLKKILEQDGKD